MRGGIAAALLLALITVSVPVTTGASDVVLEPIEVRTVDGTFVDGYIAFKEFSEPTQLVVFVHGRGQTVEGAWLGHMTETASKGPAVVSVDFRDNFGFPTLRGAQDTINATHYALDRFPSIQEVFMVGVSMGGAISGTAIAEAPGLYDYWVDIEGVSNLFETYYEADGFEPSTARGIERDAGGTPDEVPEAYVRRSPALRAADMQLKGAIVVHPLNDGLVPYDQGREMAAALVATGTPTHMYTILRERDGYDQGTTGTYQIANVFGQDDPSETSGLHLSGHAWEGDRDSRVMDTGLKALFALLDGSGRPGLYGEGVVDQGTTFAARLG